MNLLNFINIETRKVPVGKSGSSIEKDTACKNALTAFLGDSVIDIRYAVLSDFLYDFGVFLSKRYEKKYSDATNKEILRTLRKWIRQAIAQGYVPNIDIIPSVIDKLDFESGNEANKNKKSQASSRQDLKVKQAIGTMTRHIDSWAIRHRLGKEIKPTNKEERAKALQKHCIAIYLLCLFTYGLEIKEALALKFDWKTPGIPSKLFIEKYGIKLPLSQSAKNLVKSCRVTDCKEPLFFSFINKKFKEDLDNAPKFLEDNLSQYMSQTPFPLYKKKSIFIDWLNYAIECGLSDNDAEILWRFHLGLEPIASALSAIETAQGKLSGKMANLEESWYLLWLLPNTIKRDRLQKILFATGILGDEEEARLRIYAPEERLMNKEGWEYTIFSRYIFFRATPLQAEYINGITPYAYVMKERMTKKFVQIPKMEIEHMREMLRDFQDVEEMKDGKKWLEEHNAEILKGCKAIIRSGRLAGKEASVVRIKGEDTDRLTFFLEFVERTIKFQTNLEGVELDIVME